MRLALYSAGAVVLILAAVLAAVEARWRAGTRTAVSRMLAADRATAPATVSFSELDGLPPPVARYLRAVLREGQPVFRHARLRQEGTFLIRPEEGRWGPFSAVHHIAPLHPGFVWDASIRMAPGVQVRVRDGFVDRQGSMLGAVAALVTVVRSERTSELASGALHRYLAEAAWCPTALLPSHGVTWAAVDDSTARATLTVGRTTVRLEFQFGADGLVAGVYTPERVRDVGGRAVPTPWRGRFRDYGERGGMLIPLAGEVEWVLPEGPQPYWRGVVTAADFDVQD